MPESSFSERPVMTVEETAAYLGVHHSTVRASIRAGSLPSIRIGRRILVPKAALERLLAGAA